jgi:hypothetical protein
VARGSPRPGCDPLGRETRSTTRGSSIQLVDEPQTFEGQIGYDLILDAPFLSDADKEAIVGGTLSRLLRIAS